LEPQDKGIEQIHYVDACRVLQLKNKNKSIGTQK